MQFDLGHPAPGIEHRASVLGCKVALILVLGNSAGSSWLALVSSSQRAKDVGGYFLHILWSSGFLEHGVVWRARRFSLTVYNHHCRRQQGVEYSGIILWPAHHFLGSRPLCSIEKKKEFNSEISEDTSMPELNLAQQNFPHMRDIAEAGHSME